MELGDALGAIAPNETLTERVYDALEESIMNGVLPAGSVLVEDDLAKKLGVSRIPVREAIQQLTYQGLIDKKPGRSARVHKPTAQEIADVFDAREVIEAACISRAAQNISAADLVVLEGILQRGEAAVLRKDRVELLTLNQEFHDLITTASNNSILQRFMRVLRRRVKWYFAQVVVPRSENSWLQHRQMFEHLSAGNGQAAAQVMREHVAATHASLQKVIADRDTQAVDA